MSFWSIIEKSANRICTQEDLSQGRSLFSGCLYTALLCLPGLLPIWLGIPLLPSKVVCTPSKNIAECQKTQSFLNIPIKNETFQQQRKISRAVEEQISGETTLVWIGVGYIGGVLILVLLFASTVSIKQIWVFDRNVRSVQNQKITGLRKIETSYASEKISDLILEIPNICIDDNPSSIFTRLSLELNRNPKKYIIDDKRYPIIYSDEYKHFDELRSSIIQPISQILNIPWRIDFFDQHQNKYVSFRFSEKNVEQYSQGKVKQIPFQTIQRFEIETRLNGSFVSSSNSEDIDTYAYYEYAYTILLVTDTDLRLPVHQVVSKEPIGRHQSIQKSLPTNDNSGYLWAKQVETRLSELIDL